MTAHNVGEFRRWSTGSFQELSWTTGPVHGRESYTGPLAVLVVMDHRQSSARESYTGPLSVSMEHRSNAWESYTRPLAVLVVMDHRRSSARESSTGPLSVSVHGPPVQCKRKFYWSTGSFSGHGPLGQWEFLALLSISLHSHIYGMNVNET